MRTPRLAALIAATTAVGLLAACSGGTNAGSQSGGGENKTLTVASVDQGSVEDVVKAFEAANPGVKVNLTTGGADQYQQQLQNSELEANAIANKYQSNLVTQQQKQFDDALKGFGLRG